MRTHAALLACSMALIAGLAATFALAGPPVAGQPAAQDEGLRVLAWNDLGMHCMDSDFSVFAILPPYNTVYAQVIDLERGLLTGTDGVTVHYQAVADAAGSINSTSGGKTNFWEHAQALFGASLPEDVGLAGSAMPGPDNEPQPVEFNGDLGAFVAEGVPLTPYDDAGRSNPYPLMRLVARIAADEMSASSDAVLPVSDEMDCRLCHGSGANDAAEPSAGWVADPDPDRDYRLNVLRLHDELQADDPVYAAALTALALNPAGMYSTVVGDGRPILCAACHASAALGTTGEPGVPPLTQAVHALHADVVDPLTGATLDSASNRGACYRCHPGSETRCLRGVMGRAVGNDGAFAIECQSCHGTMSAVGASGRQGWLEEPACQSCHTGTATDNNGQIRYLTAFEPSGETRQAVNRTFATNEDAPAVGLDLYRFSTGHGGVYCEGCHGSTHAEWPTTTTNDNRTSEQLQGHAGVLAECTACHKESPETDFGGPHGLHPVGEVWVDQHGDAGEHGATRCQSCHGPDDRGTVLSRSHADRVFETRYGRVEAWTGFQIGCFACHDGPGSEHASANQPPLVEDATLTATAGQPAAVTLLATDADGDALQLRIVSQPGHGTVALNDRSATYFPQPDFVGSDRFTFAAWDGKIDSNLATVAVTVLPPSGVGYVVWLPQGCNNCRMR